MRNNCLRLICLVLCLALCLGGSAMAAEGKVAMGRYMEKALALPGEGSSVYAQAGGEMYALSSDGTTVYVSKDGQSWEGRESGHDAALCPMEYVYNFTVGPDGSLYIVPTTGAGTDRADAGISGSDGAQALWVERIRDGVSERVVLQADQDKRMSAMSLAVTDAGDMLVQCRGDSQARRFSPDGKQVSKYSVKGGIGIAASGKEFAVYEQMAGQVSIFDIETGEALRVFPAPEDADFDMPIAYGPDGSLYMATKAGIFTVTAGGSLMTRMIDGTLNSLSKPSLMLGGLIFDADGEPVVRFADLTTWQELLYAYKFDQSIPTEPTAQISVFTLYDNDTLREAVALTQDRNPQAKVNLVVALPEGAAITRDDAIRTLNTEILAGKGPDVIMLDELPVQSYLDKGVLLDLSDVLRPLMEEGRLLKNVTGAFEKDGAIPAVPTRFLLPTLWGNLTGEETMAEIAGWAAQNPDQIPTYFIEPTDLINEFFLACAPAWKNEAGRLDEAKLAEFLTLLKDIRGDWNDDKVASELNFDIKRAMAEISETLPSEWDPYRKNYSKGYYPETHSFVALHKTRFFPYVLRGMQDASTPGAVAAQMPECAFMPMPGQAQGVYMPYLVLGVNAGSANADIAKEFVLAALSADVQALETAFGTHGFPVNEETLGAALASTQTSTGGVTGWSLEDMGFEEAWLSEDMRKQLRGIIDALQTPSLPDFTLHQMVTQESAPFFAGKISAGQAAANIATKANAYLSE